MESDSSSIGKPPDTRSNPKSKILNPKQIQIFKIQKLLRTLEFMILNLFGILCLELRILIKEFLDALHRGIENRHSREGGNPEERKYGFRIKCGMTTCNGHFQLLLPRSSAAG